MKTIREWIEEGARQRGCDMKRFGDAVAVADDKSPEVMGWSHNIVPDDLGQQLAAIVGTALTTGRLDDQISALTVMQKAINWTNQQRDLQ